MQISVSKLQALAELSVLEFAASAILESVMLSHKRSSGGLYL